MSQPNSRYLTTGVTNGLLDFYVYPTNSIVWSADDQTYTVPQNYAFRPDLISNAMYSNKFLGWAIMLYNKINNPMVLTVGYTIRYPSYSWLASQMNL